MQRPYSMLHISSVHFRYGKSLSLCYHDIDIKLSCQLFPMEASININLFTPWLVVLTLSASLTTAVLWKWYTNWCHHSDRTIVYSNVRYCLCYTPWPCHQLIINIVYEVNLFVLQSLPDVCNLVPTLIKVRPRVAILVRPGNFLHTVFALRPRTSLRLETFYICKSLMYIVCTLYSVLELCTRSLMYFICTPYSA